MTRTPRLALAVLAALLAAGPATADHKPKFKPFNGVSPEQFYQSSVARWADQLVLELTAARAEVAAARVAPPVRDAINARSDRTAAAAAGLAKLARRTADRGQLYRAFAPVEAEYTQLDNLVSRNVTSGAAFARAGYAYQQLHAVLTEGDKDQDRGKQAVARLAGALDEQADELWTQADQHLGPAFTRDLDRAIRKFARAARRLHNDLDDTGDLAKTGEQFPAVGQAWGEVTTLLTRLPDLPAPVRAQVNRIDGLYRRLGEKVAVVVPQPGPNPAAPPAPPPVAWTPPRTGTLVIAAGEGGGPRVRVFPDPKGHAAFDIFAFDPEFRGGVRVAAADLNGDGVPDVVAAPGKGMPPLVRVFDGQDMSLLAEFYGADQQWDGGVTVAAADLTRDGRALVAVAPDAGGGPLVRVFDLAQGKEVTSFFAFPEQFRGGVRVAWADVNRDGQPDLVAAPGPGDLPPVVRVFNLADQRPLVEFPAFDRNWQGGLWVAGHGTLVVCGLDAGGPAAVRVFDLTRGQKPVGEWTTFPGPFRGGARVAVVEADGDGMPDFVVGPGPGLANTPVRVSSGRTGKVILDIPGFEGFDGGAFVGGR